MMRRFWLGLAIAMLCAAPVRADDVNVSPTFVDFGRVKIGRDGDGARDVHRT